MLIIKLTTVYNLGSKCFYMVSVFKESINSNAHFFYSNPSWHGNNDIRRTNEKKKVFVWWGHIRKNINPSQSVSKKKKKEIDNLRISRSCSHIIYYSNVPVEFVTKFKFNVKNISKSVVKEIYKWQRNISIN